MKLRALALAVVVAALLAEAVDGFPKRRRKRPTTRLDGTDGDGDEVLDGNAIDDDDAGSGRELSLSER